MGGTQSTEIPGGGTEGYHVLKVQEGSPGEKAGLIPYFDFIVCANDIRLDTEDSTLVEQLNSHIDKPLSLSVYNSKSLSVRDVTLVPTNMWGGVGLLGVSIRFCSFEGANENVWHVLDVQKNSPAEKAGLISDTDFIIGTPDSLLHEEEDFYALVEAYEGKTLRIYVYNTQTDNCREAALTPNSSWGGAGSLGCGIGYGYLHRIPIEEVREKAPMANNSNLEATRKSDGFSDVPLSASSAAVPSIPGQVPVSVNSGNANLPGGAPMAPVPMTNPQDMKPVVGFPSADVTAAPQPPKPDSKYVPPPASVQLAAKSTPLPASPMLARTSAAESVPATPHSQPLAAGPSPGGFTPVPVHAGSQPPPVPMYSSPLSNSGQSVSTPLQASQGPPAIPFMGTGKSSGFSGTSYTPIVSSDPTPSIPVPPVQSYSNGPPTIPAPTIPVPTIPTPTIPTPTIPTPVIPTATSNQVPPTTEVQNGNSS
eukprot:Nk52_evm43s230 gene=Nk52_evmTU43s230